MVVRVHFEGQYYDCDLSGVPSLEGLQAWLGAFLGLPQPQIAVSDEVNLLRKDADFWRVVLQRNPLVHVWNTAAAQRTCCLCIQHNPIPEQDFGSWREKSCPITVRKAVEVPTRSLLRPVVLRRTGGPLDTYGFTTLLTPNGLLIRRIASAGLLAQWNEAHALNAIRAGDVILSCNGRKDTMAMADQIRTHRQIEMLIWDSGVCFPEEQRQLQRKPKNIRPQRVGNWWEYV